MAEIEAPASLSTPDSSVPVVEHREKRQSELDYSSDSETKKKLKPCSPRFEGEGQETGAQNSAPHGSGDGVGTPEAHSGRSENQERDGALDFLIEADAAEDKGSRHTMEDAWVVLLDTGLGNAGKLSCAHFAIYDGHGGRLAAEYAQKHLHSNVLSAGLPRELLDVKLAKKAILDGFQKTDEALLQQSADGGWQDGATAVCIWILGRRIFVANIGDAKAVVARSTGNDNSELKAIVVTREHKAIYPQERARIQKAGGSVSSNGRLQGRLEVSRAFGDRHFKKVGVVAVPDVQSFDLTEREQFIILGCDGLWGVFGPSDAVNFVQKLLKKVSVSHTYRSLVSISRAGGPQPPYLLGQGKDYRPERCAAV